MYRNLSKKRITQLSQCQSMRVNFKLILQCFDQKLKCNMTHSIPSFVSVLDQGDARPVKLNNVEQTQRQQTTVEFIAEDEEVYQSFCFLF